MFAPAIADNTTAPLALALDAKHRATNALAASFSDGSVAVWRDAASPNSAQRWRAHTHEAWTVALDSTQPDVVYSGGDDARLVSE